MQHLAGGARTHGLRLSRMSSAVDARPEFGDGASHGLGVGHEDGIDESVTGSVLSPESPSAVFSWRDSFPGKHRFKGMK